MMSHLFPGIGFRKIRNGTRNIIQTAGNKFLETLVTSSCSESLINMKTQKKFSEKKPNNSISARVVPLHAKKKKKIVSSLSQDLINKIKNSEKRKCISVIEPIAPTKKQRICNLMKSTISAKSFALLGPNTVDLDHDYCGYSNSCSKHNQQCSFESTKDQTAIQKQPTPKNVDGQLKVLLLKVSYKLTSIDHILSDSANLKFFNFILCDENRI